LKFFDVKSTFLIKQLAARNQPNFSSATFFWAKSTSLEFNFQNFQVISADCHTHKKSYDWAIILVFPRERLNYCWLKYFEDFWKRGLICDGLFLNFFGVLSRDWRERLAINGWIEIGMFVVWRLKCNILW
jgi:hypothetical protein